MPMVSLYPVCQPASIRGGQEVSHEYEAGGRHGGVSGEELVEALHDVGAVQPHVGEEDEHGLGVVPLQLNQLLVLPHLEKSKSSSGFPKHSQFIIHRRLRDLVHTPLLKANLFLPTN